MSRLTVSEKLRIIMTRLGVNMSTLAERSGQSRQNLSNKFSRGNFTESDIETLANALGCEVDIRFILPDGSDV